MVPSFDLWRAILDLLAKDPLTLSAATAIKVKLVIEDFVPSLDLDHTTLDLATFTGSTPLDVTIGDQQVIHDPVTNLWQIVLGEPVGGWTWICTADPVADETVFGFIVTDTAGTGLLGSGLLDTPVVVHAEDDAVVIPNIRLSFLPSSPF